MAKGREENWDGEIGKSRHGMIYRQGKHSMGLCRNVGLFKRQ